MATIFVSHSSNAEDAAATAELHARLKKQKYESVFLDADPKDGIVGGERWEDVLYHQLRTCQVFIALMSENWVKSQWCFAEATHAREKGKGCIGLKLTPEIQPSVLQDTQLIDFTPAHREQGYERLWKSLAQELTDYFPPHKERPPYPGLRPFLEEDAGIYFGRREDITQLKETLLRLRLDPQNRERLILLVGASGSGKSSLVRAGLVPRLKRDEDNWLVLDPFRPGGDPSAELVAAFVNICKRYGVNRDVDSIWETFQDALEKSESRSLLFFAENLRREVNRPKATLLIIIDQVEELLDPTHRDKATSFFKLLRLLLAVPGNRYLALGTLRSDFLAQFQTQEEAKSLLFQTVPLQQMGVEHFKEVIEQPAAAADIKLDPELVTALTTDAATSDALPLLAYTLAQLWDEYGKNTRSVTVEDYRHLGGLKGCLERAAEKTFEACQLTENQSNLLRRAFLSLVRVNENGAYARKRTFWDTLPSDIHGALNRFVDARLLLSDSERGKAFLEVAHEMLFESWNRLRGWLNEGREFLLWRQRLQANLADWLRNNRDDDVLLRGAPLIEAESWLHKRPEDLSPEERDFIQKSIERRDRELAEEEERRQRELKEVEAREKAERRGKRLGFGLAGMAIVALIVTSVLYSRAERQRRLARSGQLVTQAELVRNQEPKLLPLSVLLAVEATNRFRKEGVHSLEAEQTLRKGLSLLPLLVSHLPGRTNGDAVAYSSDGKYLAVASGQDVIIWDTITGAEVEALTYEAPVQALAYSADGKHLAIASGQTVMVRAVDEPTKVWRLDHDDQVFAVAYCLKCEYLATASANGKVHVWRVGDEYKQEREFKHGPTSDGSVYAIKGVAFSPDGVFLATASMDKTARVWNVTSGEVVKSLPHDDTVNSVAFSLDGRYLATGSDDSSAGARLWQVGSWNEATRLPHGSGGREAGVGVARTRLPGAVLAVTFSRDGKYLATASDDQTARVWELQVFDDSIQVHEFVRIVHETTVKAVAFSRDGKYLATGSVDRAAQVWKVARGDEVAHLPHRKGATAVAFHPQGKELATASEDKTVRIWEVEREVEKLSLPHDGVVFGLAYSSDGMRLATASADGKARLWRVRDNYSQEREILHEYSPQINDVAFSPDGKLLATASADKTARLWEVESGRKVAESLNHEAAVNSVVFNTAGKLLATASADKTARLWEVAGGKEVQSFPHDKAVREAAFSADGAYVATASEDGTARVWDVASGVEIARKTGGLFTGVAFSPDGAYLAAAEATSIEPSAWIWETPNASLLARSIRRVAASLKLGWRTDLDSVAVARIIHEQGVNALAFGPDKDKSLLATATSDGIVRVVPWQSQDLVKAACGRLTRNLTWEEWLQYLESDGNYKVCKELPIHSSIIKAGRDLARNGNAKGALLILRKVHNETNHDSPLNPSDPNLRLDPEADVLVAEAQGLLGRGDVGQAVAKFKEALAIAPSLSFNSEPEARHSVASMLVEEGKRFAEQVKVREAVVAYGEAQQFDSTWEISFDAWDTLCRCGSLGGNVDDDMVNACERAVERAPEDKKIFSRDARGRVYAVRGKRSEASQDFQAVVQWSRENDAYDDYGKRRDEWIAELQKEKGKDTINKATFEALRYDPYSNFGCVLPE